MSEESRKKLSNSLKGRKTWNKGLKGVQIAWNKGLHINLNPNGSFKKGQTAGEKNVNWKGGITSKREQERKRLEVKLWRKACFERDNFTCHKYGVRTGGLVVHHINNFSEFPELQTAIDNGITLSAKAHQEFHDKYGYIHNTREQLLEFITI
jgi:5-methylcytosine-specific restriction endonuclease McrA